MEIAGAAASELAAGGPRASEGGGVCSDSELDSSESCGQWVERKQTQGSPTQEVGKNSCLSVPCEGRGGWEQSEGMREWEKEREQARRAHPGVPGGHSVMHHELPSQGSYENTLTLHPLHCGGDGWLPEAQTGCHILADNRTKCQRSARSRDRRAADTGVVCRQ